MPTPSMQHTAWMTTAAATPKDSLSQPTMSPPMGVDPAWSRMKMLMTRPRNSSGAESWRVVFAPVIRATPVIPSDARIAISTQ